MISLKKLLKTSGTDFGEPDMKKSWWTTGNISGRKSWWILEETFKKKIGHKSGTFLAADFGKNHKRTSRRIPGWIFEKNDRVRIHE